MEKSGLSSKAVLRYAGSVKRILVKILTDTVTDLEAIAAAKAAEAMVMKALESAGITEEMLESATKKLRDTLYAITEAELTDENIDDLFSTLHTAADSLEETAMTVIGESDGGEYSLVGIISALTAAAKDGIR